VCRPSISGIVAGVGGRWAGNGGFSGEVGGRRLGGWRREFWSGLGGVWGGEVGVRLASGGYSGSWLW
jgi:hypothetical protein